MDTVFIKKDELNIAAEIIRQGGTVVFPTETVYGLGANAFSAQAVEKIFIAKNRPQDNPLIVHISDLSQIDNITVDFNENARILAKSFMPGPITLLLKKSEKIPYSVTADLQTVGIRLPKNVLARKLINLANVPIAAPSANVSGNVSGTTFEAVKEELSGRVDCIIDGGSCEFGIESTVIDVSGEIPMILRPGSITYEMIKQKLPKTVMHRSLTTGKLEDKPASPGMKYKHYSPKAKVILVYGDISKIKLKSGECLFSFSENKTGSNVYDLGSKNDLTQMAKNIFMLMRQADFEGVNTIYIPAVPEKDIGFSIMNRLKKASGGNFIKI